MRKFDSGFVCHMLSNLAVLAFMALAAIIVLNRASADGPGDRPTLRVFEETLSKARRAKDGFKNLPKYSAKNADAKFEEAWGGEEGDTGFIKEFQNGFQQSSGQKLTKAQLDLVEREVLPRIKWIGLQRFLLSREPKPSQGVPWWLMDMVKDIESLAHPMATMVMEAEAKALAPAGSI